MAILFLTKGDKNTGSSRQRVWFLAEKLRVEFGIEHVMLYKLKRFSSFGKFWREAGKANVIFVHKSLFPWDIVASILIARILLGKKVIYDLDDAEWVHSFWKTYFLTRTATHVFAGSHIILEWTQERNKNAVLIPTVVDHEVYAKYRVLHAPREIITIGWVGVGKAHFLDGLFEPIRAALEEIWKQGIKFRFVIIGAQNYLPLKEYFSGEAFQTIFIDSLDWGNPESVPKAIKQYKFDIGLMPNSDTPFNRAKCAFKGIEYMACGVPVVASDVGEAKYLIIDGETGFLTKNDSEWARKIELLAKDPELRKKMGEKGMEKIGKEYSYAAILPRVWQILTRQSN